MGYIGIMEKVLESTIEGLRIKDDLAGSTGSGILTVSSLSAQRRLGHSPIRDPTACRTYATRFRV